MRDSKNFVLLTLELHIKISSRGDVFLRVLIASINALKELNAKNNQLEKENNALKASVQELTDKVQLILTEI